MIDKNQLKTTLTHQGLIAYPSEGVFGLGCDPQSETAVNRLLQLKQRPKSKGFLLVASNWQQLQDYLAPLPPEVETKLRNSWPGPITWICPCKTTVPSWITGAHQSIAVRISDHPTIQAICDCWQHPIVSTSANQHSQPPALTAEEVHDQFSGQIDLIIEGTCGGLKQPTPIFDALTDQQLR